MLLSDFSFFNSLFTIDISRLKMYTEYTVCHGGIAQLVARLNGIQKVRGSTPLISTKTSKYAPYIIGNVVFAINVKHRFE